MLLQKYFSLTNYFKITNRYYFFFDGMFKSMKEPKEKIMNSLCIPTSTYRVNRKSDKIKNLHHIDILKYFNVSNDFKYSDDYEKTINSIFSCVYYKRSSEEIEKLSLKLEQYILENNYLKPIFILFRVLIQINSGFTYWEILNNIKADIEYLKNFPEKYFDDNYRVLYKLVLMFSGDNNYKCIDLDMNLQNTYLSWAYYQIKGTLAYANMKYADAILYYQKTIKFLLNDYNVARIITCQKNICAIYNRMGSYSESLEISRSLVEFSVYQTNDIETQKQIIMHYLMSLLMMDLYDRILYFFDNYTGRIESLTDISIIVGIIASREMKVNVDSINKNIIDNIENKKYASYILNYFYKNIKIEGKIIEELSNIYYLNQIVEKYKIC